MSRERSRSKYKTAARPVAGLLGKVLKPALRKRGLAGAELVTAWPDIAGPQFAGCTMPERIVWPRSDDESAEPGVLVLRCAGPAAILVQHEAPLIVERANTFLGWYAVSRLKIVQGPIGPAVSREQAPLPDVSAEKKQALKESLTGLADDRLREALERLGSSVAARALARQDRAVEETTE